MSIEGIIFLAPIRIFGGMIMLVGIMPRIHITIRLMMRTPKLVQRDDCRNKTDNCSNNRATIIKPNVINNAKTILHILE